MALTTLLLDYYESLIVRVEPRPGKRALGIYLDIESNPIFDLNNNMIPHTSKFGRGGFKDEKLGSRRSGAGAIYKFDLPDPTKIFKETGRFVHLFIFGNHLTGTGTQIQAPFFDNFLSAMSRYFKKNITIFNFDEYCPQLLSKVLLAPWNQWVYFSGPFAGPDGNDLYLKDNDGKLRRMYRGDKSRVKTVNDIHPYMMDVYSSHTSPLSVMSAASA